jgi:hypothetical protein
VQRGHDLVERLEAALRDAIPGLVVFTHLEPLEDPVSQVDAQLDRAPAAGDDGNHVTPIPDEA